MALAYGATDLAGYGTCSRSGMRLSWNGSVLIARTEPRASRRFSGSVLASIPASLHNKTSFLPGTRLQALRLQQQLAASPGLCSQDPGP